MAADANVINKGANSTDGPSDTSQKDQVAAEVKAQEEVAAAQAEAMRYRAEMIKHFALAETAPGITHEEYMAISVISDGLIQISKNNIKQTNGISDIARSFSTFEAKDNDKNLNALKNIFMGINEYLQNDKVGFEQKWQAANVSVGQFINFLKATPELRKGVEFKKINENFPAVEKIINKFQAAATQPDYLDMKQNSAEIISKAKAEDMLELKSMTVEAAKADYVNNASKVIQDEIDGLKKRGEIAAVRENFGLSDKLFKDAQGLEAKLSDPNFSKNKENEFNAMWSVLKGQNKEHGRVFADNKGMLYMTAPLPDDMLNYDKKIGNVSLKGPNGVGRIPKDLCMQVDEVSELIKTQKEGKLPQLDESFSLRNAQELRRANLQNELEELTKTHLDDPDNIEIAQQVADKQNELNGIGKEKALEGLDTKLIAQMQGGPGKNDGIKKYYKESTPPSINDLAGAFYKQAMDNGAKNHVQALMVTKIRLLTMNPIPSKDGEIHNLTNKQYHSIADTFDKEINKHIMFLPNSESSNIAYQQERAGKVLSECFRECNINIQDIPYFLENNGLALNIPEGTKFLDMAHIFKTGGFKTQEFDKDGKAIGKVKNDFAMTDKTHTGPRVWGQTLGFKQIMGDDKYVNRWKSTAKRMEADKNFQAEQIKIYQSAIYEMMNYPPNGADAGALAAMVTVINNGGMTLEQLIEVNGKPSEKLLNDFYRLCGTKDIASLSLQNNLDPNAGDANAASALSQQTQPLGQGGTLGAGSGNVPQSIQPQVNTGLPLTKPTAEQSAKMINDSINTFNNHLEGFKDELINSIPPYMIRFGRDGFNSGDRRSVFLNALYQGMIDVNQLNQGESKDIANINKKNVDEKVLEHIRKNIKSRIKSEKADEFNNEAKAQAMSDEDRRKYVKNKLSEISEEKFNEMVDERLSVKGNKNQLNGVEYLKGVLSLYNRNVLDSMGKMNKDLLGQGVPSEEVRKALKTIDVESISKLNKILGNRDLDDGIAKKLKEMEEFVLDQADTDEKRTALLAKGLSPEKVEKMLKTPRPNMNAAAEKGLVVYQTKEIDITQTEEIAAQDEPGLKPANEDNVETNQKLSPETKTEKIVAAKAINEAHSVIHNLSPEEKRAVYMIRYNEIADKKLNDSGYKPTQEEKYICTAAIIAAGKDSIIGENGKFNYSESGVSSELFNKATGVLDNDNQRKVFDNSAIHNGSVADKTVSGIYDAIVNNSNNPGTQKPGGGGFGA